MRCEFQRDRDSMVCVACGRRVPVDPLLSPERYVARCRGGERPIAPPQAPVRWAYAITTVPERCGNVLDNTLRSLADARFDTPTLCVDGTPPGDWQPPLAVERVVTHDPPIGHLANWMSAIFYLYITSPNATRYAIFEDDILAVPGLRAYLTALPFPRGYWNLLTHDENLPFTRKVEGWHESNQLGRGAAGLVFDRRGVEALLRSERFLQRPASGRSQAADGAVIDTLKPLGFREFVHYPSLLQHVGAASMLGHSYGEVAGFQADYHPEPVA